MCSTCDNTITNAFVNKNHDNNATNSLIDKNCNNVTNSLIKRTMITMSLTPSLRRTIITMSLTPSLTKTIITMSPTSLLTRTKTMSLSHFISLRTIITMSLSCLSRTMITINLSHQLAFYNKTVPKLKNYFNDNLTISVFHIFLQEREAAFEQEQQRIQMEKEKEVARLRAMQERAKDRQAEQVSYSSATFSQSYCLLSKRWIFLFSYDKSVTFSYWFTQGKMCIKMIKVSFKITEIFYLLLIRMHWEPRETQSKLSGSGEKKRKKKLWRKQKRNNSWGKPGRTRWKLNSTFWLCKHKEIEQSLKEYSSKH